jgi:hypothetical protein
MAHFFKLTTTRSFFDSDVMLVHQIRLQDPMGQPIKAVPLRLYGDGAEVGGDLD